MLDSRLRDRCFAFDWDSITVIVILILHYGTLLSHNALYCYITCEGLGGLLVERRTSVSQIRGSIPGQVAAV